jgi:uncharacterized RDD family membrane protein YckC
MHLSPYKYRDYTLERKVAHFMPTEQLSFDSSNKPHAYDAVRQREYFEGVMGRRIMAFLIDIAIIMVLTIGVYLLLFLAGIFTLGLTWLLFGAAFPTVALFYNAYTLSRPQSATIGMRSTDLQMRTWYGAPMYALLAAFHALLYYFSVTIFTPFILLIAPFNGRKRCLHDFFAGTVVINSEARARTYKRD